MLVARRVAVMALFAVSGATGLVYEVLWLKELGLIFGNTGQAAAATLVVFFSGLAAGAWFAGRRTAGMANGLRVYGLLEIAVAVAAMLYFGLREAYVLIYAPIYGLLGDWPSLLLAAKVLLAFTILAPAATFMGATLPVLGHYVVRSGEHLGRFGPWLYAVNTAGAAAGALAAGFYLPAALGFRNTYLLVIATNVLIGVAALVLTRADRVPLAVPMAARPPARSPQRRGGLTDWRLAVGVAFLSGFMTLGLQVVWTRMFAQVLQNSVYTFAAILVVFLVALALGAALSGWLARTWMEPAAALTALLALGGIAAGTSPLVFFELTDGLRPIGATTSWNAYVISVFAGTAGVILLPGILIGAVFPYLMRLVEAPGVLPGAVLGRLTAVNTAGAIGGAALAGFVLLPAFGLWGTIQMFGAGYLLLAMVTAAAAGRRAARVGALSAAALVLLFTAFSPSRLPLVFLDAAEGDELVETWEGHHGVTAVVRRGANLRLLVNNLYTLGGTELQELEQTQALLPLIVHPRPRSVFFLGMGTGITAGAALVVPGVDEVVVTELIPDVVTAARSYFATYTRGLFTDPRVTVRVEDGRNHLLGTPRRYDAIISDLFIPWEAGTGSLYTREHFTAAARRLEPGGVFVQWLPLFQLSAAEFMVIARTMLEVFPDVVMWRGDFYPTKPTVALVGRLQPATLDPAVFIPRAREMSGTPDLASETVMVLTLPFYVGNLTAARLIPPGPVNSDDRPIVEYAAAVTQRAQGGGAVPWFVAEELVDFQTRLMERMPPEQDPYLSRLTESQREYVRGGLSFYRATVLSHLGRDAEAERWFDDFSARVPVPFAPGEEPDVHVELRAP